MPLFDAGRTAQQVRMAEDAWKGRDPPRVALAYTPHSFWRSRSEFLRGRDQIIAFLGRKWAAELEYRLIKELWAFAGNRIAVGFPYEWLSNEGRWFPFLRQREQGVRRQGPEGWPHHLEQRPAHRRRCPPFPLERGTRPIEQSGLSVLGL